MENLYSRRSNLVLGFHGCDQTTVDKVMRGGMLYPSKHDFDWLGHGIYFWQNNPKRALEYALESMGRKGSKIIMPAVLGAVIDLGNCLDLIDSDNLRFLKDSYDVLQQIETKYGVALPKNEAVNKSEDKLLRKLDCAVIEMGHALNKATLLELTKIIDDSKCLASNLILMLSLENDLEKKSFETRIFRLCIDLLKSLNSFMNSIIAKRNSLDKRVYKDILMSLQQAIKALDIINEDRVLIKEENIDSLKTVAYKLESMACLFTEYDSVRGVFWEGKELYPGAGFADKNHIQLCVRNPNCIKGFFLPRDIDTQHPNP